RGRPPDARRREASRAGETPRARHALHPVRDTGTQTVPSARRTWWSFLFDRSDGKPEDQAKPKGRSVSEREAQLTRRRTDARRARAARARSPRSGDPFLNGRASARQYSISAFRSYLPKRSRPLRNPS